MDKGTHANDAQIEQKGNQRVLTVKDSMLLTIKDVQLIKTGVMSTCGGQPKGYASILKQN